MDSLARQGSLRSCEKSIRQAPIASVSIAFLAGLLFRILPIAAIVKAIVRAVLLLVRPALLVLGVTKAGELLRKRA